LENDLNLKNEKCVPVEGATMTDSVRTVSITGALQELKMLRKRVDEKLMNTVFVSASDSRVGSNGLPNAAPTFQSIRDLIARIRRLDSRIKQSNSTAQIQVGNETYTVAEALALKEQLVLYTAFRDELRSQFSRATQEITNYNARAQTRLDDLLRSHFGKDSKTSPADHDALTAHFKKNNSIEMIDPIGIEKAVKEMTEFIDTFTQNVDVALAESNALTRINAE